MLYYAIPLSFDKLLNSKDLTMVSLGESIAQFLQLIIETPYGAHQGDMNFGCELWDFDFELMIKAQDYEQRLSKSLLDTIIKYENRLTNIVVNIVITNEEIVNTPLESRVAKQKATINVSARIKETEEAFSFQTSFYLNPMIAV